MALRRRTRRRVGIPGPPPRVFLAAVLVVAAACSGDDSGDDGEALRIEVVSSRPEHVTGGSARVAVIAEDEDLGVDDLQVLGVPGPAGDAEDRGQRFVDFSDRFAADPHRPGRFVGVVDGLVQALDGVEEGQIVLEARAGDASAEVTVTNHPTTGPLFSGEQLPLMECTTEQFGLDPTTPEDGCEAPAEETWQYVDTQGEVHDLDDPSAPPDDVRLLDLDGAEAPFVIRTERGVLNRAVYQIQTLANESAWNERLVYRFGGGCGATFGQGTMTTAPWLDILERGYATATATFNTFGVLCNDVISAETMSMVKEHFVVDYGEPTYTIGEGASGGAIQQLLLAQNYPGLLDGIVPSMPFPDALSISGGVIDCRLLHDYYGTGAGGELTEEQRLAINGHATVNACQTWDNVFVDGIVPTSGCATDEDVYDAEENPNGFRCTFYETNVALIGRDPDTGFARSAYDNQGVQYGLVALNEGVITPEQFLDLNEQIGGFDIDGRPRSARSAVGEDQVRRAHETGRVTGPWGGLPDTAIILIDPYTDLIGDFHDRVRSFAFLDRLAGGQGDDSSRWPENVSLWSLGEAETDLAAAATGAFPRGAEAILAMDEWLTGAGEQQAAEGGSWQDALAAAKPESAESRCLPQGERPIVGPAANGDPACAEAMPVHGEPRMAAGAPRAGDVLKCQRISVDDAVSRGMYEVEFDDGQVERLAEVFSAGVCDYSQPGIGQTEPTDVWPSFQPS